jgi:hypothetical protein
MADITRNIRDWIMVLSDNREIHITNSQKNVISEWIKSKEPLIELYDIDTNECLFS